MVSSTGKSNTTGLSAYHLNAGMSLFCSKKISSRLQEINSPEKIEKNRMSLPLSMIISLTSVWVRLIFSVVVFTPVVISVSSLSAFVAFEFIVKAF